MLDGLACLMVLHGLPKVAGVQWNPGIVGRVARQINVERGLGDLIKPRRQRARHTLRITQDRIRSSIQKQVVTTRWTVAQAYDTKQKLVTLSHRTRRPKLANFFP
jgi:hypothetical protein